MTRTRILGTGRALPSRVMTNADLERTLDTSDAWIRERTGIGERRILEEGRSTSDLAAEAAAKACRAAGVTPAEIDCIILATVTPDMPMPACAVFVQQKLGATNAAAFDLSAACAGFIYGISIADSFIRTGQFKKIVVIGVEVLSRILDWKDRNTCVLFGDGAGAAVLGADQGERGILSTHLYTDGSAWQELNIPAGGTRVPTSRITVDERMHYVKMNGREIYRLALKNITRASQIALEHNAKGPEDVDWVIAHQANLRILEGVADRLKVPLQKFHLNIQKYGNTSSASIPIALDEAVEEGKVKNDQLLLFCALGAGVSWGSALVRW